MTKVVVVVLHMTLLIMEMAQRLIQQYLHLFQLIQQYRFTQMIQAKMEIMYLD